MSLNKTLFDFLQPLALGSFRNWIELLVHNKVDDPYVARAAMVTLTSFATSPLRLYEWLRYSRQVEKTEIVEAPIFIIGHWRSGTTHLHNLMCLDQSLGYVTTLQTIAPQSFLVGEKTVKSWLARLLPPTRVMDNMTWSLDGPQEEEFAIANLSPYSFYHHWSFPRRVLEYFEKYALFRGVSEAILTRWKLVYLSVLRKATLRMGNRRLVLKNPTNTGRIRVLLDLFPEAKFLHIYRNPYRVFQSTRHLYRKTLSVTQLQEIGPEEVDAAILTVYRGMMGRFLEERALIPPGNLVEVRFEDLESHPMEELRRVYRELSLPGFESVKPVFEAYLSERGGYQKNAYPPLDQAVVEKINREWRFALDAWGYPRG